MMTEQEQIYELAKVLFLRENSWGHLDRQDQNIRLHYIEMAERVFDDLRKAGLTIIELEGNDDSEAKRPGNPPDEE